MAGSIRLYGGPKAALPRLAGRMPGLCTDTDELYVGSEGGNILLASADAAAGRFGRLTLTRGDEGTPGEGQLAYTGGGLALGTSDGAKNVAFRASAVDAIPESAGASQIAARLNMLIAALKASGVMEE